VRSEGAEMKRVEICVDCNRDVKGVEYRSICLACYQEIAQENIDSTLHMAGCSKQ